jgi:hypothetical protein
MKSPWGFWVRLFSDQEEGTSLALFRIAIGMCTLYSLLSIAGAGLVGPLWTHVDHGGMRALTGNWFVQLLGGTTPGVVWGLWVTAFCCTLACVAGLGGRIVGKLVMLTLLLSYNGLITINSFASGGYDVLMTNAFWILLLAEPNATLSLHARTRTGSFVSDRQISAWPRYVLLFQLLVMYTFTGLQKTALVWTPAGGYTALYWITQDPTWMRFDGAFAAWVSPLLRVGTAVTWHWEQMSIFLLLWYHARYTEAKGGRMRRWILKRDWRIGWALVGLLLHLGILILVNVGPFSWVTLAFYFLLWTPSEHRRAWLRWRLRRRRTR